MYGDQFGEFLSTYILGLKGLRGLTNRGAYNNPRWLISTIKESSWKQALAVVVKICYIYWLSIKLQNNIINKIHFNTSQRGMYIFGGDL